MQNIAKINDVLNYDELNILDRLNPTNFDMPIQQARIEQLHSIGLAMIHNNRHLLSHLSKYGSLIVFALAMIEKRCKEKNLLFIN